MNKKIHVLLLAGGSGARFGSAIPKQFVEVDGVPIIVHTLKRMLIEIVTDITIVCIEDWIPYLKELIKQYNIPNVRQIVPGGSSGFESMRNGINAMASILSKEDIIVIHDSVRPLVPRKVILDAVEKASEHGIGCASLKSIEGLVLKDNDECGVEPADRYRVMRIQTPQAYQYGLLESLLEKAKMEGKDDFPYADGLCTYYKVPIYFSKSFPTNTKITTKPDIAFLKAMLQFSDEELLGEN